MSQYNNVISRLNTIIALSLQDSHLDCSQYWSLEPIALCYWENFPRRDLYKHRLLDPLIFFSLLYHHFITYSTMQRQRREEEWKAEMWSEWIAEVMAYHTTPLEHFSLLSHTISSLSSPVFHTDTHMSFHLFCLWRVQCFKQTMWLKEKLEGLKCSNNDLPVYQRHLINTVKYLKIKKKWTSLSQTSVFILAEALLAFHLCASTNQAITQKDIMLYFFLQ